MICNTVKSACLKEASDRRMILFCHRLDIDHRVDGIAVFGHGKVQVCALFDIIFCRVIDIAKDGSALHGLSRFYGDVFELAVGCLIAVSEIHDHGGSGLDVFLR